MRRREQREHVFKLMFMTEFNSEEEMTEQLSLYFEGLGELSEQDQEYMKKKYAHVKEHLEEIDALLNGASRGWKTKRMSRVDLAALRLAVYEMEYDADVPTGVAINEAVELAKRFGGDASGSFVNGVLGKIASEKEEKKPEEKSADAEEKAAKYLSRTHEKCLFCRPDKSLRREYVYPGLFSPEGLCERRSIQLQISHERAYLFFPER